jgi:hypothetical protein
MSHSKCKEGPIPDTIYRCTVDGHEVTAVYHSRVWREAVAEPFEVECADAATKEKVLAAWEHEWEIDREEIRAGRRSPHSTPEGILQGMLETCPAARTRWKSCNSRFWKRTESSCEALPGNGNARRPRPAIRQLPPPLQPQRMKKRRSP